MLFALLLQAPCNEAAVETELKRGSGLYREGKLEAALAAFEAAKALCAPPRLEIVYNLGLTHWKLGRIVEAHQAFEACLADPELKPLAERKLADIKSESYLVVRCEKSVAEVSVDGIFVGRTPLEPIRLMHGPHHVLVKRDRDLPRTSDIVSTGGQVAYVDCGQGIPAVAEIARKEEAAPPAPVVEVKETSEEPRRGFFTTGRVVGVIAAVAGLATTGVGIARAAAARKTFDRARSEGCPGYQRRAECDYYRTEVDNYNQQAEVLIGVGALVAVSGATLLLIASPAKGASAGVAVRGTF